MHGSSESEKAALAGGPISNRNNNRQDSSASAKVQRLQPLTQKDFVLATLQDAVRRVRLIDGELATIGQLLRDDRLKPHDAWAAAEQVAPGCLSSMVWVDVEGGQ